MASVSVNGGKDEELRKKIVYRVSCEERAHRIVERLIDNPVTQEHLLDCLQYITPSHYADVVEERAVSKLCGYPLCLNSLGNVPKQKYMISTKTNKVYDIEARKNFCGSKCYKASKHLEVQISDDPVWMRKNLPPRQYHLLSLEMDRGKLGDEVVVSKGKEIKTEIEKLEKQEKYFAELVEKYHQQEEEGIKSETKTEKPHVAKSSGRSFNKSDQNREDSCVYTLETAMDELGLEDKMSKEGLEKVLSGTGVQVKEREEKRGEVEAGQEKTSIETEHDVTERAVNINDSAVESMSMIKKNEKHSGLEKTKHKHSESRKVQKTSDETKAKTDYLMQLLDKRKNLLCKMVDIQNAPDAEIKGVIEKPEVTGENSQVKSYSSDDTKIVVEGKKEENVEDVQSIDESCSSKSTKLVVEVLGAASDKVKTETEKALLDKTLATQKLNLAKDNNTYCKKVKDKQRDKHDKQKDGKKSGVDKQKDGMKSGAENTKSKSAVVELICKQVQTWITKATMDYLKVTVGDSGSRHADESIQIFEKEWRKLEARVDAQEREFDALLGEEELEDDVTDHPKAPLPHFDVLRKEVEETHQRVQQFMKGSFTYKITEKPTETKSEGTTGVVLPTVDRYDQLIIRQKIVLDRISKVLPDVLSPLHLLVQDVFTELRELICTFNLTSENILYRPAEWTIVTLVLLRMLSRKVASIENSFKSPGAEKYFLVLLSGIGASVDTIDNIIQRMIGSSGCHS